MLADILRRFGGSGVKAKSLIVEGEDLVPMTLVNWATDVPFLYQPGYVRIGPVAGTTSRFGTLHSTDPLDLTEWDHLVGEATFNNALSTLRIGVWTPGTTINYNTAHNSNWAMEGGPGGTGQSVLFSIGIEDVSSGHVGIYAQMSRDTECQLYGLWLVSGLR